MALVRASGRPIGLAQNALHAREKWYISDHRTDQARRIMKTAESIGMRIVLPIDYVLDSGETRPEIPEANTQRDIGPETVSLYGCKVAADLIP